VDKPFILVVGGAGYIGAHMVKLLAASGYRPVVLDDLSGGASRQPPGAHCMVRADMGEPGVLDALLQAYPFAAVMHFASFIQVGESMADPARYYENNVAKTLQLLGATARHNAGPFIFSSTAAIFGEPLYVPIDERHPREPINPYGRSKWMVEQMLADFDRAYGLRSGCLRYFNAAGADPDALLGECHLPETHLVPLVLQAASGRRESITVYGENYETPDGTCIRDYIHVCDLCDAHLLVLEQLLEGSGSMHYNLGNGAGYSILEVIGAAERVTGRPVPRESGPRRAGDPPVLLADATLAKKELRWEPRFADLDTIILHAWRWEQKNFCHPRHS
jgi:UDP-glucose 4-epimerase